MVSQQMQFRLRASCIAYAGISIIASIVISVMDKDLFAGISYFKWYTIQFYIQLAAAIVSVITFSYSLWGRNYLQKFVRAFLALVLAAAWLYVFINRLHLNLNLSSGWICYTTDAARCYCDRLNFYLSGVMSLTMLAEIGVTLHLGPMTKTGIVAAPILPINAYDQVEHPPNGQYVYPQGMQQQQHYVVDPNHPQPQGYYVDPNTVAHTPGQQYAHPVAVDQTGSPYPQPLYAQDPTGYPHK